MDGLIIFGGILAAAWMEKDGAREGAINRDAAVHRAAAHVFFFFLSAMRFVHTFRMLEFYYFKRYTPLKNQYNIRCDISQS